MLLMTLKEAMEVGNGRIKWVDREERNQVQRERGEGNKGNGNLWADGEGRKWP